MTTYFYFCDFLQMLNGLNFLYSEKQKNLHFVHFKEHALLHLSTFLYEILDLGFPVNATAPYRSPISMYNVTFMSFSP